MTDGGRGARGEIGPGRDSYGRPRRSILKRGAEPSGTQRLRQLTVLTAALSVLVAMMSSGANASSPVLRSGSVSRSGVVSRSGHAHHVRSLIPAGIAAPTTHGSALRHIKWRPPVSSTVPPTPVTDPPASTLPPTTTTLPPATTTTTLPPVPSAYPIGIPDASEPSGMAPPGAQALPGYSQSYVSDFAGSALPSGWETFSGQPGSDPGAQWDPAHVVVSNGMLQLNTWRDPSYGDEWVAGGLCQCGVQMTYGSYFVRSRMTGAGPTGVQLLWPVAKVWPPEIDFNETDGTTNWTSATVHYTSANREVYRKLTGIDMTKWHTWGVIWTPDSVTYTLDGKAWASVTGANAIPQQAMTLDLTQQTWCASGWACPSAPQSMQVDWVAEYATQ